MLIALYIVSDCVRNQYSVVRLACTCIYTRNTYPHICLTRTPRPHAQPGQVLTDMIAKCEFASVELR